MTVFSIGGKRRVITCCAIIPLANAVNGSTSSCSPSGLKSLQWNLSITGFSLGSTETRCAHALSNRFSVVVPGTLAFCEEEGPAESKRSEGYLTTLVPPGVWRGAFVACVPAFRLPAGLRRGFVLVWDSIETIEGVGVRGGS